MPTMYQHNTEVVVTASLVDASGLSLDPTALSYVVNDEAGALVVASTAVVVSPGMTAVEITIPAASNDLGIAKQGLRSVIITIDTVAGTFEQDEIYLLKNGSILELWVNTFQTYHGAILASTSIPSLSAWEYAPRADKDAAMITAFDSISKLNFVMPARLEVEGLPEKFNLKDLELAEWEILPVDFLKALRNAQIVECEFLLSTDTVEHKRLSGLMSESIGESSVMFRPSKPMTSLLSERAYKYLQSYIANGTRIGRS